ncbi:MAG TPA: hypothetical protein VKI19_08525 [Acidimicrobiales bacterium]|nr:hypothetical protein [Acidimicrobiales bacterium]
MVTAQLEYKPEELLADPPYAEPLRAGGVLCHGGYLADGTYLPPRTAGRVPAIRAWQEKHTEDFATPILDAPLASWPGNYPNLAQARLLLRHGIREPIIAQLTRIGTVEGFGANIRHLAPDDMQRHFVDDIRGTATAHLGQGLVEAHARDEAGWDDRAGHNTMWFAVRDIAFEHPRPGDMTERLLERLGFGSPAATDEERVARFDASRSFPDLDTGLEMLLTTMTRVLFIEIKAFHVFAWAESLLSDRDLVAGEGEAARLVACIRADETPHVEYLRTALTEMRDRTFVTVDGGRRSGREVIGTLWDRLLAESMGTVEEANRGSFRKELGRALEGRRGATDLLEEFDAIGDWKPSEAA